MLRVKMEQVKLHISHFCKIMNVSDKNKKSFTEMTTFFLKAINYQGKDKI